MSKLKPCPFCGGDAIIEAFDDFPAFMGVHHVVCPACRCDVDREGEEETTTAWNRRPIEDAQAARIAELEAAIQRCCRNCWAHKATDAAQCRTCGLKTALKGAN